jgi:hypothetical protein
MRAQGTEAFDGPLWLRNGLIALALLLGFYGVTASLSNFARFAGFLGDFVSDGAKLAISDGAPPGWFDVAKVSPGSPAAKAGLQRGDRLRFRPYESPVQLFGGAPKQATVDRAGHQFDTAIVDPTAIWDRAPAIFVAASSVGALFTIGIGLMLLIRAKGQRAAVLLGLTLLAIATNSTGAPPWAPNLAVARLLMIPSLLATMAIGYLWPVFSLEISGGPTSRRQARLVQVVGMGSALLCLAVELISGYPARLPLFGSYAAFWIAFVPLHQLFGYSIIVANYRDNDAPARNRINIVMIAFVCYLVAAFLRTLIPAELDQPRWMVPMAAVSITAALIAPALFAYAVLRQRLFDVSFALNRTLVFATISFIVLASFGLTEWAIKHLISESWEKASAIYSALIALVLFMALHGVRDWVERQIERLFFRSWHRNDAALRRFVAAAHHFEQRPALCRAFAEEVQRFTHGAAAALYLRTADGAYALEAGDIEGGPCAYAEDDSLFALMRAERRPVQNDGANPSALPAGLAMPFLDQGQLTGFVLVSPKPDRTDFRPDELELLGWAAHQVGLDLQALHARHLEAEVVDLRRTVALVREERDRVVAEKARLVDRLAEPPLKRPA